MKNHLQDPLLQINLSALLLGTTGYFAKTISLSAAPLSFGRALVAVVTLFLFYLLRRKLPRKPHKQHLKTLTIQGILLGLHWITFLHSMQISTVAIGMISLYTFPLMTVFLEAMWFKSRVDRKDIFAAIAVVCALAIMTYSPDHAYSYSTLMGVAWGLVSAACFAFRNILSRHSAQTYSGPFLLLFQSFVVAIFLIPSLFYYPVTLHKSDLLGIFIFGTVFTAFAHGLFVSSMKKLEASSVGLILSVQPVYGIVFSMLFLNEYPTVTTLLGGAIILAVVLFKNFQQRIRMVGN